MMIMSEDPNCLARRVLVLGCAHLLFSWWSLKHVMNNSKTSCFYWLCNAEAQTIFCGYFISMVEPATNYFMPSDGLYAVLFILSPMDHPWFSLWNSGCCALGMLSFVLNLFFYGSQP
jgi:hypothetical protein